MTATRPYDSARYLDTPDTQAEYLTAAFETGDPGFIAEAIGTVARARGMTQIARDAGLSRESLYRTLSSGGNPELGTVMRVLQAMGLRLAATPADKTEAA
ncbi:putative addiction module antidote protein [Mycobacterium sp. KBS0706]|uniref:addiction module antidote protein n=1 Tax=Mycobacterium sp. KBS0706 TaxID=2578109 RepID=UPI00110F741F|nr:addiction module antidote protein [Mycobacterium sp. KBS0706]TSD90113.1 putative addiction module antidote protein [Mycobacterium sp. KBS0706]